MTSMRNYKVRNMVAAVGYYTKLVRCKKVGMTQMGHNNTLRRHDIQTRMSIVSHTSSEGERLMLEALVESSHKGPRTVLQYIKMLSVIALPVTAVICLVSYTLHNSRVERVDE